MARLGKMVEKTIDSAYLKEEKTVKIYLPQTFDFTYETKLCFMQDGDDYFQIGPIASLSDKLHDHETVHNTVFIGIHYADRSDRLKKYHPNGDQYNAYQQFLIKEVLPIVDESVPLNPLGISRSLMGDSLAGTFAILTALAFPDKFKQVIMQSPLIDGDVLDQMKTAEVSKLSLYHSIGLKETAVQTTAGPKVDFVTPNREAAVYLEKYFTDYIYSEIANGNHTWKFWQKELPEVLEDMFS